MYRILVSATFRNQFHSFSGEERVRIKNGLQVLADYPITHRSGADIKPLRQTVPKKYRLRIGDFRIIYTIQNNEVMIIEIFRRGRGYEQA